MERQKWLEAGVEALRARFAEASDIVDRGCPDSTVLDFLAMTARPPDCDTLLSNPPYGDAMNSSNTHGRCDFAWSCSCSPRHFCSPPTAMSACTSAATCAACMSWPSGSKICTMRPTSPPAARVSRASSTLALFDRDYSGPAMISPCRSITSSMAGCKRRSIISTRRCSTASAGRIHRLLLGGRSSGASVNLPSTSSH